MTTEDDSVRELRQRAEEKAFIDASAFSKPLSPEETERLIYELRVHQIELEMQNEELHRTHHELAAAKDRYYDLYDLAPVGYLTLSSAGIIREANFCAATLLGVTRKDLLRRSITDFILPEDQQVYYLHRKHLAAPLSDPGQANSAIGCEIRLHRPDSSIVWVYIQEALPDNDEYRITLTDITELNRAHADLRQSEERFRTIFERSTVGKSLTATDGRLLKINQAFADMLGYSIEEMQQFDFAQVSHPDDVAESWEYIRSLMAGEQTAYRFEKRYIHKSGAIVWGDVSTMLLRDEQGAPL
ncbi:MAG: PAS domain S-box protein [Deltaproteobacteria bacterium]|nr:PAS domain S-box protein [Deltaproteobacteria bacterium]